MDSPGLLQAITFRLVDSLPKDVLARLAEDADDRQRLAGQAEHQRASVDAALDAGHGECLLQIPEIAGIVEDALLHFDGQRYRLIAWCIMPNHAHVLVDAYQEHSLPEVVHSWKSFTANAINRHLGRGGQVWQRDYFDRYIRDDTHLQATIDYIENNPVAAGLASGAESWRFSSAAQRQGIAGRMPALPEAVPVNSPGSAPRSATPRSAGILPANTPTSESAPSGSTPRSAGILPANTPTSESAPSGSAPRSAGILPATSRITATSQSITPAGTTPALREKHHE